MPYKTLLVHVDNGKRSALRVDIACRLAKQSDAHLIGLHALTVVKLPSYVMVEGGVQVRELNERIQRESAVAAEQVFKKAVKAAGATKTEWRASRRDAVESVPVHGRYADLLVIGQPNETDGSGVEPDFAERLLLAVGRPALVIPYAGDFPSVGNRVLVAWNASREATRAVTDAIPILREAQQVDVIAFNPKNAPHGEVPGADIGLYLARHGIKVNVSQQTAEDVDVGNQLLSRAADLDSDLIVMGAYGHSRMQELIMGGATRTVLKSMTVPVLMSH
ncbi:MAG TPA: universal stress protein [Burkholderiales bacterium]|nr:universal stress protein [Burkholderiales bacterium]